MSAVPSSRLTTMEQMRRAKRAILLRNPEDSLAEIISSDRDAFSGIRLLFASDAAGVPLDDLFGAPAHGLPIARIFCGRGLLAFSDGIEREMAQGGAHLRYGTRTLLDTNFLSHLPRFCEGLDFNERDRVASTIEFIETHLGRTLEWTYASLENMREVIKPNNPWPYMKVAAAKLLDEMPAAFRVERGAKVTLDKHLPAAEDQWRTWIGSPEAWRSVGRRDLMYAVTTKAMLEGWQGTPVVEGLRRLVEYCLDRFELLPLKELYFGWKTLRGFATESDRLKIFSEPALRRPGTKSIDRLSALAWDLFLFRWCETLCTLMRGNSCYVPVVTTLDAALLDAIQSCPLRAVLIHDTGGLVETIFDDEYEFQVCLDEAITGETLRRINDPVRRARKPVVSPYLLSASIAKLESEVRDLAKQTQ